MYAQCLGIKEQKDVQKAIELLKANGIDFDMNDPLDLFELDEAKFRMTELYSIQNQETGEIEEPNLILIQKVANAFNQSDYLDYDVLDDLLADCLEANGYELTRN